MSPSINYSILIHYSEIALKLKNRPYFERIFINNIKTHTKKFKYTKIELIAARVFIQNVNIKEWNDLKNRLENVMGLQNATLMIVVRSEIEAIKEAAQNLIKNKKFKNFRITTKRQYKEFKLDSNEINFIIGKHVQTVSKKPVKLTSPDLNIIIELLKNKTYIGYDKIKGYSGLPANCQEKAISLISSGIDSPVASFEMIKRGVQVEYLHFHSYPAINKQSITNVKKILQILNRYQLNLRLYLIPLLVIQQEIMKVIPDKYWVIFFRRYMIKAANILAEQNNAVALITGESVGQVASQTLSNIRSISEVSTIPILRPLSGYNKEEIINKAKKIGTYNISIKPYQDCCSFFVPRHPETKAKIKKIQLLEDKLNLNDILLDSIKNAEVIDIKFMEN